MNKKIFLLLLSGFFIAQMFGGSNPAVVLADETPRQICTNSGGEWRSVDGGDSEYCDCPGSEGNVDAGQACAPIENQDDGSPQFEIDEGGSKINTYLQNGINLLTALAGLAITASVIIGGIQYSTSGGNPTASAAAKKRIGNAFLALLALVFLYTFLQWIVPGGIFGQ